MCRALSRSKIDYGTRVYGSAEATYLREIEVIPNEAIRIAAGPVKSTPISSMHILVNEKSLELTLKPLSVKYFHKQKDLR